MSAQVSRLLMLVAMIKVINTALVIMMIKNMMFKALI